MSAHGLHAINASLQVLPAAMGLSKRLLLTQKSSSSRDTATPPAKPEAVLIFRATKLTSVLRNIEGYNHDGLNE